MAIRVFTGTPGSGKTLRAVRYAFKMCKSGKRIITNMPLRFPDKLTSWNAPHLWTNKELTVENFKAFDSEHHERLPDGSLTEESQTLVIVDECHLLWGDNYIGSKSECAKWEEFFSQHRKHGFDFLFVTQHIRRIDRSIRENIETETYHLKFENAPNKTLIYAVLILLFKLFRFTLFIGITSWVHFKHKDFRTRNFFTYSKKFGKMFNTFMTYESNNATSAKKREEPPREAGQGPPPSAPDYSELVPEREALFVPLPEMNVTKWGAKVGSRS
ncbi:hypothetical protein FACS1894208_11610 [Clostridia bacterium]|nr:hypothetical protein FACS1894208_11610 [Clostridia bacterium]